MKISYIKILAKSPICPAIIVCENGNCYGLSLDGLFRLLKLMDGYHIDLNNLIEHMQIKLCNDNRVIMYAINQELKTIFCCEINCVCCYDNLAWVSDCQA